MAEWGRLPARFRATQVVAKGRRSGVLIAEDLEAGGTVVVRVLPARGLDQDLRAYLERTRRGLATANAPPMQVIDSGRVALLSREYIPGRTLDERLAGPPELTVPEFLHIAASAVGALGALHDLGVVHGNIKGSNLVLCEGVRGVEGSVSLVDHGMGRLAPVLDYRPPSNATPVPMDAAADVSAMAALLRTSFEQVLREQAVGAETASPAEKRLVYLARDVLRRLAGSDGTYNTLAAAANDLRELSCARRPDVLPELTPGAGDLRQELGPAGFVSRPAEWELLTTALGAAREDRSRSVLVQGPAGIGKTRLCREFARWAGVEESARCIYVKSEPTVASRPHLVAYQLMQELHQERPESGTPRHGVLRPTDAARRLVAELRELAVLHNPVVVTIDDCHFARAEDVAMMQSLAEMLPSIGPGVLVIFIRRSVTAAHHAPAMKTQHHITMTALRPHSVRAMLASMAGRIDDAVVDEVVTWADGSPLHAQNAIRFLVDHGAVVPSSRGWTSAGHLPVPPSVLADRLRALPLPARRMLTTAAVIGYRGRMDVLAGATGTSPEVCAAEVAELIRQGFLENQTGSHIPMFGFAHDTVRDAALADDTGTHVAHLHRRVAEVMLESAGTDEFDLAFHLAKADDLSGAYPYAVAAARTARRRYSLGTAREYYELALSAQTTDELLRELGEVLMLDGSYGDAAEVLTEALSRCAPQDVAARAQVSRLLGETYFKSGALEQAERCFLDALSVLGENVPESDRGFATGLVREMARHGVRRMTPLGRVPDGGAHIELRAAVLGNLAYCWWFHNSLKTLWAQAREMELAHHCAVDGPERPHAYATHAVVCGALLGRTSRAVRYGEAAMSIRALGGDEWGEAHAMHLYGVALVASGDYQRAVDVLAVAVERFDRTADRWEAHTSRWHRAWALYRLGALEEAAREADIVANSAAAIGDRQASVIAALTHALVSDGERVDPALTEQVPDRYDAQTAIASLLGRAICALGSQDLDSASVLLDRAAEEIRRRRLINAYVAPVLSWRATVALWRADAARCGGGPNRRRALRGLALSVVAAAASSVYAAERGHARQALRQSASALRAAFLPGIGA